MDWENWNVGGKTIFVASCVAAGSMFVKWVDVGFISANGLSQGGILFLGVFIYPFLMLMKKNPIHMQGGIACGAGGVILGMLYISSVSKEWSGESVNFAAVGPYIFIGASIALIVGVVKYQDQQDT